MARARLHCGRTGRAARHVPPRYTGRLHRNSCGRTAAIRPTALEARANAEQPLEHLLQGEITPEQWGLDEALARQAGDLDEVAGGPGADYTISGKQATGEALEDGAAALREALRAS